LAALPGTGVIAFGHMGDGNLHFNLVVPVGADARAIFAERERMSRIVHDLVDALGGSISAEHGIGLLKIDEMKHYNEPSSKLPPPSGSRNRPSTAACTAAPGRRCP